MTNQPPSRHDNPFATCWTRPGALPFLPAEGVSAEGLLGRWLAAGRRGQVVGPHGVGKSTLLLAVGDLLAERGEAVQRLVYRADQPPSDTTNGLPDPPPDRPSTLLIDGLEQLAWHHRRRLRRRLRSIPEGPRLGVLATTHRPIAGLPVLAGLAPSLPLVMRLHQTLTRDRPSPVTQAMVAKTFAEADGDIRELWFRLYDLHETLARPVLAAGG